VGSCNEECRPKRFNYFADWDPSALKEHYYEGYSLLDANVRWYSDFQLALSATLRHYPRELGLLLFMNVKGETPFQKVRNAFSKERTWKEIKKCLDESNGSKILLEKPSCHVSRSWRHE
jgi:hypothetical protein